MKLHEIKSTKKDSSGNTETVTIDAREYGEMTVDVKFNYEGPSSTRHGDNASFDENMPSYFEIVSIKLAEPMEEYNEYNELVKTWPKGTDVTKLKDWNDRKDEEAVLDKLYDLENR